MKLPKLRSHAPAHERHEPRTPGLSFAELEELVSIRFEASLSELVSDTEAQTLEGVLFGSIPFSCGIDAQNGVFEGGIRLANGWMMTTLLGEKISLDSDAASVERSLATIERYCRHRLTDEFLDAFDASPHIATRDA